SGPWPASTGALLLGGGGPPGRTGVRAGEGGQRLGQQPRPHGHPGRPRPALDCRWPLRRPPPPHYTTTTHRVLPCKLPPRGAPPYPHTPRSAWRRAMSMSRAHTSSPAAVASISASRLGNHRRPVALRTTRPPTSSVPADQPLRVVIIV